MGSSQVLLLAGVSRALQRAKGKIVTRLFFNRDSNSGQVVFGVRESDYIHLYWDLLNLCQCSFLHPNNVMFRKKRVSSFSSFQNTLKHWAASVCCPSNRTLLEAAGIVIVRSASLGPFLSRSAEQLYKPGARLLRANELDA